jgi:hypothetical protein
VIRRPKAVLVDVPRPSATPDARQALAELIASIPAAEPFLNTESLCKIVLNPETVGWQDWLLTRPVGLVYWLANWKRPQDRPGWSG